MQEFHRELRKQLMSHLGGWWSKAHKHRDNLKPTNYVYCHPRIIDKSFVCQMVGCSENIWVESQLPMLQIHKNNRIATDQSRFKNFIYYSFTIPQEIYETLVARSNISYSSCLQAGQLIHLHKK